MPNTIAFTGQGPHGERLVAPRAQPHRREPDLARALRRRDAAVRGGHEGRRRAPRGRCGAATARRCTSCRTRAARRTCGRSPSPAATRAQVTSFKNGRVRVADDRRTTARRSCSSATSAIWSLDVASGKASRGADHAARRERRRRRRASNADAGIPVARAVARRKEDRVHRARRRLRGVGARRRRRDAHHDHARAGDASSRGRRTAGGSRTSRAATARRTSTSTTSRRAPRPSSPTGRANDVAPTLVARRQDDRVHARRQGAARRRRRPRSRIACSRRASSTGRRSSPIGRSRGRPTDAGSRTSSGGRAHSRILISSRWPAVRRAPVSFLPNANGGSIAWSPDGTYLLFDTSQRTEDGQIARVDLDSAHAALSRGSVPRSVSSSRRARARRRSRRRARRRPSATRAPSAPTRRAPRRVAAPRSCSTTFAGASRMLPVGRRRAVGRHQSRRQDGADQRERRGPGESLYATRSTSCPASHRSRGSSRRRPGFKSNAQFTADSRRGVLPRERAHQRRSTSSRARRGRSTSPPSSTSTSRARRSRCSTRRGGFSPTTSSTRR